MSYSVEFEKSAGLLLDTGHLANLKMKKPDAGDTRQDEYELRITSNEAIIEYQRSMKTRSVYVVVH